MKRYNGMVMVPNGNKGGFECEKEIKKMSVRNIQTELHGFNVILSTLSKDKWEVE